MKSQLVESDYNSLGGVRMFVINIIIIIIIIIIIKRGRERKAGKECTKHPFSSRTQALQYQPI